MFGRDVGVLKLRNALPAHSSLDVAAVAMQEAAARNAGRADWEAGMQESNLEEAQFRLRVLEKGLYGYETLMQTRREALAARLTEAFTSEA